MKEDTLAESFILAIETSTQVGSVALFKENILLGHLEYHQNKAHARLLMPMIQTLLADLEIPRSQLKAIGVSKGPGSYTGLRVGVATAKGLAMSLNIPLLAMDALAALSWQVKDLARLLDAHICPMIDARRMEVYTTFFDKDLNQLRPIHAQIVEEYTFDTILKERKIFFVGDGVAKCRPLLNRYANALPLPGIIASAKGMGDTLYKNYNSQTWVDLERFEPFYLKDFVATKPKKKW